MASSVNPYGSGVNQNLNSLATVCQLLQARRMAQNNTFPSMRYEISNPYADSLFTQADIDMRRKAEVLRYRSNAQGGQTNGATKRQLFARMNVLNKSSTYNSIREYNCQDPNWHDYPSTTTTPMPSSYSGVPGKKLLFYNPGVPLCNMRTNPDTITFVEQYTDIK